MSKTHQLIGNATLLAAALGLLAGPVSAGPGGSTPLCQVGIYTTADEFLLDQNNNGLWDGVGGGDVRFTLAQSLAGGVQAVGDYNGDDTDEMGRYFEGTGNFVIDLDGSYSWTGSPNDRSTFFVSAVVGASSPVIGTWGALSNDAIGKYMTGTDEFFLDWNGNGAWDGAATDRRFKLAAAVGAGLPVTGEFSGGGSEDNGKYIQATSQFVIDANGNQMWDGVGGGDANFVFAAAAFSGNGVPLAANFNPVAAGDELAVYNPATGLIYVDYNNSFSWDGSGGGDRVYNLAQAVATTAYRACSFSGDGVDQTVKVFNGTGPNNNQFVVDLNGDGVWGGVGGGDRNTNFVPALAGSFKSAVLHHAVDVTP